MVGRVQREEQVKLVGGPRHRQRTWVDKLSDQLSFVSEDMRRYGYYKRSKPGAKFFYWKGWSP